MTPEFVMGFARRAMEVTMMVSAPMLGFGLIIGLTVSIFQAVTSIQEMTLTFIPKILGVMIAIIIFLPWMLQIMVSFTADILINFPVWVK
ncbi:MAG: flagellar biosynthetic protein FliQ [bacterium]|nr:MAG: flagellar biosynthetic protein FliQ [bacterium]